MDLVYPIKASAFNLDLVYSLRSMCRHAGFDRVWVCGYKPEWVQGVGYIQIAQNDTKWKNALNNVRHACMHPEVSDDFVLMNDDFIALRDVDLSWDINLCGAPLQDKIAAFAKLAKPSRWQRSFAEAHELLRALGSRHFMSFMLHVPMKINKRRFMELMLLPEVERHLRTHPGLSFRTLYGNMEWTNPAPVNDVKIPLGQDLPLSMAGGKWLSVYDNVIGNPAYPRLAAALAPLAEAKCRYEK